VTTCGEEKPLALLGRKPLPRLVREERDRRRAKPSTQEIKKKGERCKRHADILAYAGAASCREGAGGDSINSASTQGPM
jgi:hypothetical protein